MGTKSDKVEQRKGVGRAREARTESIVEVQHRRLARVVDRIGKRYTARCTLNWLRGSKGQVVGCHGSDCTGLEKMFEDNAGGNASLRGVGAVQHLVEQIEDGWLSWRLRACRIDDTLEATKLSHDERSAVGDRVFDANARLHAQGVRTVAGGSE